MWYWREENFRGLHEIVARLSTEPDLNGFRDYCLLREQGLRREAFFVLAEFVTKTQSWTAQQRRDFVRWIIEIHQQNPRVFDLIPHPLQENLIAPTIREWQSEMPSDPIPFRLGGDEPSLRIAILLDSTHQETILRMVQILWSHVEMACHELPAGVLGSTDEVLTDLDEIEKLAASVDDSIKQDAFASRARLFRQVVQNYVKYLGEVGRTQCFRVWAGSNGLKCTV